MEIFSTFCEKLGLVCRLHFTELLKIGQRGNLNDDASERKKFRDLSRKEETQTC